MNLQHLKYIIEIEKTGSITKAAENLFLDQPNLSRNIKELEKYVGFSVFSRTSKGVVPTEKGEELIRRAKSILVQIAEIEAIAKTDETYQTLMVCVPRASYIANIFADTVGGLDRKRPMNINYQETNTGRAIENILSAKCNLAVVRYSGAHQEQYLDYFEKKGLAFKEINTFIYQLLLSEKSNLASKCNIYLKDLAGYIRIVHGDPFVIAHDNGSEGEAGAADKNIYVYERGSQFELLSKVFDTYMWVSPVPDNLCRLYGLTHKKCVDNRDVYWDTLIYRKGYKLTGTDRLFVNALMEKGMCN